MNQGKYMYKQIISIKKCFNNNKIIELKQIWNNIYITRKINQKKKKEDQNKKEEYSKKKSNKRLKRKLNQNKQII